MQHVYKHETEAHSYSHFCCGKAINISYSECLPVDLDIQHAMRFRLVAVCGLSGCTTFFHMISCDTIFGNNLLNIKYVF